MRALLNSCSYYSEYMRLTKKTEGACTLIAVASWHSSGQTSGSPWTSDASCSNLNCSCMRP